jgi:pyroglutamyl-peptidase
MNRPKRILLYGFGPYRQFRDNITARILQLLPPQTGLTKVVFPVRFHRLQFIQALHRYKPDIVLGLGQSTRKKIEVEMRAANRKRGAKNAGARPISARGPRWLPTTLRLKLSHAVRSSKDAGDYVCNYSMYVMLDHIRGRELKTRYGFIHIPFDHPRRASTKLIARTIRNLIIIDGRPVKKDSLSLNRVTKR